MLHQLKDKVFYTISYMLCSLNLLNRRIRERSGLEGTFKDHLVQPLCHATRHRGLDYVAQSPI